MSADTLEHQDTTTTPITDDGDHDRFSHYVRKGLIVDSAITGAPVRALCGKVWTPGRDPEKFPVCPECRDIISDDGKLMDNDA